MKIKVKIAQSFREKILGQIDPNSSRFMVFFTRFGIHTFFMKHSLDILVLDQESRVKIIKKNLAPNRLFFYRPTLSTVVELPTGFIDSNQIRLNDKIELIS